MKYRHEFTVRAPQPAVADFHCRSESMGAITPPPVLVQVHRAPETLAEGDEMDFTMWLGPMPIRWVARIEQTTPVSFVDRQVSGPFAAWEHLHTYVTQADGTTKVIDRVTAELSTNWFWRLVGLGMWLNLPVLFAYRGWKTRRILEAAVAEPVRAATHP
jgi:ligand-binding SRPBCC domain-containing protein